MSDRTNDESMRSNIPRQRRPVRMEQCVRLSRRAKQGIPGCKMPPEKTTKTSKNGGKCPRT
jgi:hypothetical protein